MRARHGGCASARNTMILRVKLEDCRTLHLLPTPVLTGSGSTGSPVSGTAAVGI
jgi:hypothetical protein